jgi:uncharacterized membrane protein
MTYRCGLAPSVPTVTSGDDTMRYAIELSARLMELFAVAIIVVAVAHATGRYLLDFHRARPAAYQQYKVSVGKALLLGLEFLVAADVVRTVVLEPSLENVVVLAVLVVVRTFLSWSVVVEIEGRWPWHGRAAE